MRISFWLLPAVVLPALAADPPVTGGTKPVNYGSMGAGEGPAWNGRLLYFTEADAIRTRDMSGKVSVFREPSGRANGLLFDAQGRLIACEAGKRRVTRTEKDGSITVLADHFEGHRFNSPNDLALDAKGRIYFTDPRYGNRDSMEMKIEGVYRIDEPGKVTRVLGPEVERPNGIAVSTDERYLYVADNNNNKAGGARKLWRFRLRGDGSVDGNSRKLIYDWKDGRGPDGVKFDSRGRLFVAGGLNRSNPPYEPNAEVKGGVYVITPAGKLVEFIPITVDEVTNCAFGGPDLKTLFVTAGGTLWSVPVLVPGRR